MANKGAPKGAKKTGPHTISLSSIQGGHSPDKRKKNGRKKLRRMPPIEVEQTSSGFLGLGASYRLIDGTDRCYWTAQAGKSTIRAYVWR